MHLIHRKTCRRKVIASGPEVFEELGVPPDRQIDLAHPEALAAALALKGPTVLARRPIGWAECAARTLEVLREVAACPCPIWPASP